MDNQLKPEELEKIGKPSGMLLHVCFMDGYEKYYELIWQWESDKTHLSVAYKSEANYLYLHTPTGERFIPMCNIREFGVSGQVNNS